MAWAPDKAAGEFAGWVRDHDPVLRLAARLSENGALGRSDIRAMDEAIQAQMLAVRDFAAASPWPDADLALAGTFA